MALFLSVTIGAVFSCLGLSVRARVLISIIGLVAGGTWAELSSPNDMLISIGAAFESQLEVSWHETLIWVAALTMGALFCRHFLNRAHRST
jgi:hypothetical protein